MKAAMFKDQIKVKNEMEIYLKNRFFVVLPSLFVCFLLKPHRKEKKIKMRIKLKTVYAESPQSSL